MEWHFRVDGIPATQGSKKAFVRGGKVSMVEVSKKLPAWRKDVAEAAQEVADTDGTGPLDFPLEVKLDVYLPVPKKSKFGSFPAGPPDVDKLQRAVGDALKVGGLIKDDARICRWVAEKHWADEDHAVGCEVRIRQLEEAEVQEIARGVDASQVWVDEIQDWQPSHLTPEAFWRMRAEKVAAGEVEPLHEGVDYAGGLPVAELVDGCHRVEGIPVGPISAELVGNLAGIPAPITPEQSAEALRAYQEHEAGPIHPGWFHGIQPSDFVIQEHPISRESAELFFGHPLPAAIPPEEIHAALERFSQRKEDHVWVSNDRVGFRIQDPVFTEMEGGLGVTGTFPEFLAPFLRAGLIRGVSVSIDGDPETTISATVVPDEELFDRNEFTFRMEPRLLWGLGGDLSKPFPDEPENRMEAGL